MVVFGENVIVVELSILGVKGPLMGESFIFTGPRCLWGPVYGSRSLYLSMYVRQFCETLLM